MPDRREAVTAAILSEPVTEGDVRAALPRRQDWRGERKPHTIRLPAFMLADLERYAGAAGMSVSDVVALIVWVYLYGPRS